MSDDDSRGNESPDRPHVSTDNIRAPDDTTGNTSETRARLEIIDQQARHLLESASVSEDGEAVRHCREIRAEVDRVRLLLLGPEAVLDGVPLEVDAEEESGKSSGSDNDADSPATDFNTDPRVPMIVHRGERVTTYLGPDPDAYELEHGDRDA
ncbi:hypothetical protein [Natronoglomus mannanivorans]|uniref:Uncharacterized protein n=1 Tax=Natronoglomus mannanivorans TaxID=2979990 RepID=A0AAP2YYU5_9EURY|nr:hypothetical protein [Halobacteria archaeon AArc-xg1-1]